MPGRGRVLFTATLFFLLAQGHIRGDAGGTPDQRWSSGGQLAQKQIAQLRGVSLQSGGCFNEPDCDDTPVVASSLQSETSIAVDTTGQHVVIAFNDFRGFAANPATTPLSISGFMYSDDGGRTFVDGGRLPSPGTDVVSGQLFPQVFGDPDVKYVGGCTFAYASLGLKKLGAGIVQGLVFHRSVDCGHTWQGPFDVGPSNNPNGIIDVNGDAVDAADKEMTDVDPDTGRYMICWSNFTTAAAGGVEISCTYSDNVLDASPTFVPRRVISATASDGQAASVRFAGNGSANAVVAWSTFPAPYLNNVRVARSSDNGVTWSAPTLVGPNFLTMDHVLGNDRVHNFPTVAIDTSAGLFKNRAYLVYAINNSLDGADITMQYSSDGGLTWTPGIFLNSRPGNDRAQWFPYVTVDASTGRVIVFYYDQGTDTSGDLTEVTYTFSDDGGITWTKPVPLSDRPFRAGWGNDTGQPNLGDYNQAVARFGSLWASFAVTHPVGFADGQPSTSMTVPDVDGRVLTSLAKAALQLETPTMVDSGGNGSIDRGEQITLTLPVRNYVTNPLSASTIGGIVGTLSSVTPGVTIVQATSAYPDATAGSTVTNATPYRFDVSSLFTPGTPIELVLDLSTTTGSISRPFALGTGTPLSSVLLTQNFDGVAPGALPAGWIAAHGAGPNIVPWRTSNTFAPSLCGTSNKAFHAEANDVPGATTFARWERLFSPVVVVPSTSAYVTVDFDVCYDTEDDPNLRVLAYDGFFLRVTDVTPGRTLRSALAESFEQDFTTGSLKHYPKHFPRSGNPNYFEDMSAWAGFSGGVQHVHLKLPGMAGSRFQLRFEYTQDEVAICSDVRPGHACGVAIDNIVVANVVATSPAPPNLVWRSAMTRDSGTGEIVAALTVQNTGGTTAQNVTLTNATLGSTPASSPLPATLGAIGAGASAATVVRFPGSAGPAGATSVLRLNGTLTGGTTGGTIRVTLP
jgi:hypothetical protein